MKFMDIATQSGTVAYFLNKDNSVDCDKFIKWWYLDYAKIVSELNPNANYEIVPKQDKN